VSIDEADFEAGGADRPAGTTPVAPAGAASWSAQPPRREGRLTSRNLLITMAVVVVAVIGALAVVVNIRGHAGPPLPDPRPLLVAVPPDALACPEDDTLASVDRLADSSGLPSGVATVLRGSGLRSMAIRCWLTVDRSLVVVLLARYDTSEHAAQLVSPQRMARLKAAGAVDFIGIPGVPGGRTCTMDNTVLDTPMLVAIGSRATTAFVVTGKPTRSVDKAAIDDIAERQYDRLPRS
jgi:hypothetical protein